MRLAPTKPLALLSAFALAGGLAACEKHEEIKHAETEGIYVNVGELKYQVQISRQLNPSIALDRTILEGVDPSEADLATGETWFAVFLRIENESDHPQTPAEVFEIEDQQGEVFEPVEIEENNPFHFSEDPIRPGGYAPTSESVARQIGSIGGMLQLFKVRFETLENRPLELLIRSHSPEDEATIDLDV